MPFYRKQEKRNTEEEWWLTWDGTKRQGFCKRFFGIIFCDPRNEEW